MVLKAVFVRYVAWLIFNMKQFQHSKAFLGLLEMGENIASQYKKKSNILKIQHVLYTMSGSNKTEGQNTC